MNRFARTIRPARCAIARRPLVAALLIALCAVSARPAGAQDTVKVSVEEPRAVQPERPTVATHAHTVAPGYVEVEAGVEGDRYAPGARSYLAPVVVKVGLASHVQLNLAATGFARADAIAQGAGPGDASVGVKWRLLDDHRLLGDFAILPAVKLPTGSVQNGTGTGTTDVGVTLISSYEIRGIAVDLNAAYTRTGSTDSSASSRQALWTASFGFPVTPRLGWVAELFGAPTVDGSGATSSVELLTGPTFLVSPALGLDVGLITPLRGERPNALYVGAVWNLGRVPGFRR